MFSLVNGFILISSNNFFHSNGFLINFVAALNAVHCNINDQIRYVVVAILPTFLTFCSLSNILIAFVAPLTILVVQYAAFIPSIDACSRFHTHCVIRTAAIIITTSFVIFQAVFAFSSLKSNRQYQTMSL
jgi:hypothetical protein